MFKFDDTSLYGKDAIDKFLKSYSTTTKGFQAIAAETAEYTKKSFESTVAHWQALAGIRSFESAIELQANFTKDALEGYVAELSKLGELYSDLTKEAYEPAAAGIKTASDIVKTKAEKAVNVAAA